MGGGFNSDRFRPEQSVPTAVLILSVPLWVIFGRPLVFLSIFAGLFLLFCLLTIIDTRALRKKQRRAQRAQELPRLHHADYVDIFADSRRIFPDRSEEKKW